MTWARYDDQFDVREAIEDAWEDEPATLGLHLQATTACCRDLTDGVIHPRWLRRKLPGGRAGARLMEAMLRHELFTLLPAGDTQTLVDEDHNEIPVGPFDEDRYIVRAFLRFNYSSVQVKTKRQEDAERKRNSRRKRPSGVTTDVRADGAVESRRTSERRHAPASRAAAIPGASQPNPTQPTVPPDPPEGGRQRDKVLWEKEQRAWIAAHLPGADVRVAESIIGTLRSIPRPPTPEAIIERAEKTGRRALLFRDDQAAAA